MTTEHLDLSDTRRPWTRPTLRRLSSGGQAGNGPTVPYFIETSTRFNDKTYVAGPFPS